MTTILTIGQKRGLTVRMVRTETSPWKPKVKKMIISSAMMAMMGEDAVRIVLPVKGKDEKRDESYHVMDGTDGAKAMMAWIIRWAAEMARTLAQYIHVKKPRPCERRMVPTGTMRAKVRTDR